MYLQNIMMNDSPLSISDDATIIHGLRQNDFNKRKAEDQLFTRYSYFIKEGIHKYSLTEEEAFDAYSDTVLYAIGSIASAEFEERSSIKTYLYKIFCNKCVDLIRKKTTNKQAIHQTAAITNMLDMIADAGRTVVQRLIDNTDAAILKLKLAELGDNCRQMLSLFADGYPDKEIAVVMAYKSADVVKTSRLRCLEKLKILYTGKTN